jgi:cysteine desulfurase family protein
MSLKAGRVVLETREALAQLFNIKSIERIVFTSNATDAVNLSLKGLLKAGDHVITTSMEHNSVARPIKALERFGVKNTIVTCDQMGILNPDDVESAINKNTKLIVSTHASNVTGTLMPIAELGNISQKHGVKFMVDSAQTAGTYDIDVEKLHIDLLAFTGHKGLYGIQGVGGLYIREGIELETTREGGTGSQSESLIQPEIYPDKYESGTLNTPGIAALLAGIQYINKIGLRHIREQEAAMGDYFINCLKNIDQIKIYGPADMSKQSAVISINIGEVGSSEVAYILDNAFDIATRSGLHCAPLAHNTIKTLEQGTVRFSIGYFNTRQEVDSAVNGINKIAKEI